MKTPNQLKEARAERIEALEVLTNSAEAEGRDMTTEESQRADDILNEVEALDKQIERAEKVQATLKAKAVAVDHIGSAGEDRELARAAGSYSLSKAVKEMSTNSLSGLEREMKEEALKEFRDAGITPSGNLQIPIKLMEARAVATTSSGRLT